MTLQLEELQDAEDRRAHATQKIQDDCYNANHYLTRAIAYQDLGYPDLAVGDAYKAMLLVDEVIDDSGWYHEVATNTFLASKLDILDLRDQVNSALVTSLMDCECFATAYEYAIRYERYSHKPKRTDVLERYKKVTNSPVALDQINVKDLPTNVMVRREIYPWNKLEPDRKSHAYVAGLNEQLKDVAPKCEARVVSLPILTGEHGTIEQLGIFAKEDINPGEIVLSESSLLAVNNNLHDSLCDACSGELPQLGEDAQSHSCPDCNDTVFCSQKCLDDAKESYHPAVCNMEIDSIARDPDPKEAGDALYFLLLARTIAMAQTQDIHPLELKQISSLWGDFSPVPDHPRDANPSLPFSFKYNILEPLHLLMEMEIDIYAETAKYDFWIFNTLYAKFRGVASARPNLRTGAPEVCAVHPLWCLANHSCAPNVTWEWSGNINLVTRKDGQIVRWGPEKDNQDRWQGGIKAGKEILNHYCDTDLDVVQRREWAQGPLGGDCVCGRCRWEANHELPDMNGLKLSDTKTVQ